jgi:AAA domain, putative AbiEii toxin, Type IV TA system
MSGVMARSKAPANPAARTATKPGIYFLSLTVENVRCFGPAQTLDLSDGQGRHAPWTIILGENGLGKTTLLTCLAATASGAQDLASHFGEWLGTRMALYRGSGNVDGNVSAVFVSSHRPRRTGVVTITSRRNHTHGSADRMVTTDIAIYNYGASRRMPASKGLSGYDQRVSIFLDDDVALRDPQEWLLTADYNARLRGRDRVRLEAFAKRVRKALIRILPEVADLRIEPAEEPGGSPRVEARTPDGWIPLRRLGFGYQSQIAWLVDFASRMFERYPDRVDPLAEPAIVLVDEIDLHLHPRWQRQIIGELTELCPKTQFIVTAHSPLIVQAAGSANVALLRREDDHVVIDNDPEVLRNWRVDQILTSELFGLESARPPQIEEPLKERRRILAKPKLSKADEKRLVELEQAIGDLPAGETAEDSRAIEMIRRAATKLSSDA